MAIWVAGQKIGETLLTLGKYILPETLEKIMPNVKNLTTLERKTVYLDNGGKHVGEIGQGFISDPSKGRIFGIQTDATAIYIDLCTPESVAAALSN